MFLLSWVSAFLEGAQFFQKKFYSFQQLSSAPVNFSYIIYWAGNLGQLETEPLFRTLPPGETLPLGEILSSISLTCSYIHSADSHQLTQKYLHTDYLSSISIQISLCQYKYQLTQIGILTQIGVYCSYIYNANNSSTDTKIFIYRYIYMDIYIWYLYIDILVSIGDCLHYD